MRSYTYGSHIDHHGSYHSPLHPLREDSAGGLWVTNALGESRAIYGNKELSSRKSNTNLDQFIAAVQSGLDEVWSVFSGRSIMPEAILKLTNPYFFNICDTSD